MKSIYHTTMLLFSFLFLLGCSNPISAESPEAELPKSEFLERVVVGYNSEESHRFINNYRLFEEGWDTVAQTKFWMEVISLSHDSMIMNIASVRQPLFKIPSAEWHCQTEAEKGLYKRNVCISNELCTTTTLYVTSGKKFFFEFKKVVPMISTSIAVFEQNQTDPWYAQTILLIESPGKTQATSYVGARGPFQLMPYVARKYGLVVSKTRDDRTDLEKSASAAAKLISGVCIPEARRILGGKGINFSETDLWFRLFVMHIYHAGAGNVGAVINKINPVEGGMGLIRQMWQTEAAGFRNESQNYSQIALASMVMFDRLINQETEKMFLVEGDRKMLMFHEKTAICVDTLDFLDDCITAYGNDLLDGMIPIEYYQTATIKVKDEIKRVKGVNNMDVARMNFEFSDKMFALGNELMFKRKFKEAAQVFHMGIQMNPVSPATYDSLGRAYKSLGKYDLAMKYSRKSKEVFEFPDRFLK